MSEADRIHVRAGDAPSTTPDLHHRVYSDHLGTPAKRAVSAADSAALVNSNTLPPLDLEGNKLPTPPHESGFTHFVNGAEARVGDLAKSALNEVVNHPGKVIAEAEVAALVGFTIVTMPEIALPFYGLAAAGIIAKHEGWLPEYA